MMVAVLLPSVVLRKEEPLLECVLEVPKDAFLDDETTNHKIILLDKLGSRTDPESGSVIAHTIVEQIMDYKQSHIIAFIAIEMTFNYFDRYPLSVC